MGHCCWAVWSWGLRAPGACPRGPLRPPAPGLTSQGLSPVDAIRPFCFVSPPCKSTARGRRNSQDRSFLPLPLLSCIGGGHRWSVTALCRCAPGVLNSQQRSSRHRALPGDWLGVWGQTALSLPSVPTLHRTDGGGQGDPITSPELGPGLHFLPIFRVCRY